MYKVEVEVEEKEEEKKDKSTYGNRKINFQFK